MSQTKQGPQAEYAPSAQLLYLPNNFFDAVHVFVPSQGAEELEDTAGGEIEQLRWTQRR